MVYNLTEQQRELAKWLFREHQLQRLGESFKVSFVRDGIVVDDKPHVNECIGELNFEKLSPGSFEALSDAKLLQQRACQPRNIKILNVHHVAAETLAFTILGNLKIAVASNFIDERSPSIISTIAQTHPPEIAMSIDRFRERYPDPKRTGFLIMRFAAEKPYARIVDAIRETAKEHQLTVLRADDHEFHTDLLSNVRTYLHCCGFGIAVYDRIKTDEPNANVGLEVGYCMAMNKPVLLLKDQTIPKLQTDLAGRLYRDFDAHDPIGTIPGQLTKWLEDYGIIVRNR
jgi:hypothetical protein